MRFVAASDAIGLDPAGYGLRPLGSTPRAARSIRTARPVIKDVYDRDAHLAQAIAKTSAARN